MIAEVAPYLHLSVLVWARCVPLFVLVPYLAVGVGPRIWGVALSWAYAGALTPLWMRGCGVDTACSQALQVELTWSMGAAQLLVGSVIALGVGLPCAAFRTSGSILQALVGWPAAGPAGPGSELGRVFGLSALVALALADAWSGVSRLVVGLEPALGAAVPAGPALRELLMQLGLQLLRAFALGVSLSAPMMLAALFVAVLLGLLGRLDGSRLLPRGPALLPWLGVGLASLCVANWLDVLPGVMRSFAQTTARLLAGLP